MPKHWRTPKHSTSWRRCTLQTCKPIRTCSLHRRQVEEELEKERGALGLDEQVALLLHSLRHDSASVQATAVQARPAACARHPCMSCHCKPRSRMAHIYRV